MNPLDLIKLTSLMARSRGSPAVRIGLIDGPVATAHPDLARELLREFASDTGAACTNANSSACMHGTFVAGVLAARRTSSAPAICQSGCSAARHMQRGQPPRHRLQPRLEVGL